MNKDLKPGQAAARLFLSLLLTACADIKIEDRSKQPPEDFVDLKTIDSSIRIEIRYFTANNFVGAKIDGYEAPRCWLTRNTANALKKVQKTLTSQHKSLKVFDCYRPQQAVNHFVRWAENVEDQKTKSVYYPAVAKSNLFKAGYLAEKSGHSRGSTVDLTIIDIPGNRELDMGTVFDFFDPLSNTGNPLIGKKHHENRTFLKTLMERNGFSNLKTEWWHFTLNHETYPNTYFDFPIQ